MLQTELPTKKGGKKRSKRGRGQKPKIHILVLRGETITERAKDKGLLEALGAVGGLRDFGLDRERRLRRRRGGKGSNRGRGKGGGLVDLLAELQRDDGAGVEHEVLGGAHGGVRRRLAVEEQGQVRGGNHFGGLVVLEELKLELLGGVMTR